MPDTLDATDGAEDVSDDPDTTPDASDAPPDSQRDAGDVSDQTDDAGDAADDLDSTIRVQARSGSSAMVTVVLERDAPCRVFYRRAGAPAWTARVPSEDSSNYGTGQGHNQLVEGLSAGTWEFYAEDHVSGTYKTQVVTLEILPNMWTTVQDSDWGSSHPQSDVEYRASWSAPGFVQDAGASDAWRVRVGQNENYGASEFVELAGRPKEVWMRYRVLIPTNSIQVWRASDGAIKMPGLAGDVSAANGGYGGSQNSNRPHSQRAWSARQLLSKPTNYVYGMELYWQGSTNNNDGDEYGDTEWYSPNGSFGAGLSLTPGVWGEVEVRVRMNDVGQSNGFIETFLDGVPGYSKRNMEWTKAQDMLLVRRVWFQVYHGGSAKSSPGELSLYFRSFAYRIVE